jgi:hypothetical protein
VISKKRKRFFNSSFFPYPNAIDNNGNIANIIFENINALDVYILSCDA